MCVAGLGAVMVGGCATAARPDRNAWITEQGGVVSGPLQERVDAALARLAPAIHGRSDVRAYVLGSDAVGAFSWPDRTLFVQRRLVELLTDVELSAALAHELGHLLNDGHLQGVASLRGCCRSPDQEVWADARGVELLKTSGLDPAAMPTMLTKVRNLLPHDPVCRRAIARRIEILSAAERQN